MPRTEAQNALIKDKRRAKLLAAALRVFARKGYCETSVDDITRETGCSHGLFYHYFDAKPAIFRAMIEELVLPSKGLPPYKEAIEAGGYAGLEIIADYIEGLLHQCKIEQNREHRHLCYVALASLKSFEPEAVPSLPEDYAGSYHPITSLCRLIEQGQKEGKVIEGDPWEIADIICCVLLYQLEAILFRKIPVKGVSKRVFLEMITNKKLRD